MAITKIIADLTDLNKANTTKSLKMPSGGAFSGTATEGMLRNDTSQSSANSASTMQFYNGNEWKNFDNIVPNPFTYTPPSGYSALGGTFDSTTLNNFLLTNSDLTAYQSGSSGYDYARGTQNTRNTTSYCEITIQNYNVNQPNNWYVGLVKNGAGVGYVTNEGVLYSANGKANVSGYEFFSSYGASYTTGDVISILYNSSTRQVNFWKNGVDQGTAGMTFDASLTDIRIMVSGGSDANRPPQYTGLFS